MTFWSLVAQAGGLSSSQTFRDEHSTSLEAVYLLLMSEIGYWVLKTCKTIKIIQGESPVLAGLVGEQMVRNN